MGQTGKISFIIEKTTEHITANYPEIGAICRLSAVEELELSNDGVFWTDFIVLAADPVFFTVFDYPLLYGNKETALRPGGIVITKHLAEVIFGHQNVVGEEILLQQN